MRLAADAIEQRLDQPRLAHAGFAGEQDGLALALLRQPPALQQQAHLLRAADERRENCRARRFEPARQRCFPQHPPGRHRIGKAFEHMLAAAFVFESASEQAVSRVGNNDGVRLGQCLQACGKVRRFADDQFFARGAATDNVADNNQSRRDADAGLQAAAVRRRDPANRIDDGKRRAHGAFGGVFVRLRIAKIGEHAVAEEFGDISVEPRNPAGAGILVALDQVAHVLGIKRGGERCRTDEIAEQDRDLSTLGFRRWDGFRGCRGRVGHCLRCLDGCAMQGGDCFDELSPMTEGNPELLEIGLGQIGKNVEVDVIVGQNAAQRFQAKLF